MNELAYPRKRSIYLLILLVTICLGFMSRTPFTPDWLYPYLGDVLYATAFVWLMVLTWSRIHPLWAAIAAVLLCYTIELTQLYQADWLNEIRSYRLGGLILGFSFRWEDLICYAIGAGIGYGIDWRIHSAEPSPGSVA